MASPHSSWACGGRRPRRQTASCLGGLGGRPALSQDTGRRPGLGLGCPSWPGALQPQGRPEPCPPRAQINCFIFIRILHILVAKLRAHQMRHTDYKFRWVRAGGPGREGAGMPSTRAQAPPPQAGQVHADPHPPAGGPRGGVCLRDRRACPGHPALHQALLRPLPQLLPGARPPRCPPPSSGLR